MEYQENRKYETTEEVSKRIQRTLSRTDNNFALLFVLVNLPEVRKKITKKLIKNIKRPVIELTVNKEEVHDTTLDNWLNFQLNKAPKNAVVFLYNLDDVFPSKKNALRKYLQQLNWRRSSLAAINRPLVIWLPRYAIDNLAKYAPDFYDWYSNVYEFNSNTDEINQINNQFLKEFDSKVHPDQRMSLVEKQKWINTINSLLDENKNKNQYRLKLLTDLGRLYISIGEHNKALEMSKLSLSLSKELGHKEGIAASYGYIGNIYLLRNENHKALEMYKKSLSIYEMLDFKEGMASVYGNIGNIYLRLGDNHKALEMVNKSLIINELLNRPAEMAIDYGNTGIINENLGNHKKALELFHKSLVISEKLGRKSGVANTYGNIGGVYNVLGDYSQAIKMFQKSLNIYNELGNIAGVSNQYNNIGITNLNLGDFDMALQMHHKSLDIEAQLGRKPFMAIQYRRIAIIYNLMGKKSLAIQNYQKSKKIYLEIGAMNMVDEVDTLIKSIEESKKE